MILPNKAPENWTKARVRYYCDVQLGKMLQTVASSGRDELKPYLRAINIGTEGLELSHRSYMWIRPQESDRFRLTKGDILVSEGGDAGRTAVFDADDEYYFQNSINRVRPNHCGNIVSEFIYYWFTFLKLTGYVEMICNVATIPHFTVEKVKAAPLTLPPLDTQRRIARFLDEKTEQIDKLIEKKRALLDRLAEKRQALITRAVTKGLNPDAPMKPSGIDWLGNIPAHWEVLPLNRVIRMGSGDYIAASEIEADGEHFVFGGNGVRGFSEHFNTIGPIVLVGRQGAHCGNVHVAYGKVWISEHALRCFPEKRLETQWLAYVLGTMNLNQYSVSAAQPGLSVDNLKHLRMTFPPLNEQREIADHLHAHCCRSEEVERKAQMSLGLLNEYRSALITTAVTGQLEDLNA